MGRLTHSKIILLANRILLMLLFALVAGCAPGRQTVAGGVLGAASGAAVGSMYADAGKGAVIGAGVGALGGYLASPAARPYPARPYPMRRCAPGFYFSTYTQHCRPF